MHGVVVERRETAATADGRGGHGPRAVGARPGSPGSLRATQSVRGVIVRYRGPAFCEVRTTKDIVVNFKKSHLTQTSLTDEEAASCSRALSSTEYLQARVDGAICVRDVQQGRKLS